MIRADTLADAAEIELVAYEPGAGGTFIREWSCPLDPAARAQPVLLGSAPRRGSGPLLRARPSNRARRRRLSSSERPHEPLAERQRVPDILDCLAQLSSDEVPTPPKLANAMLDLLPDEVWRDPDYRWLDPCSKSGVFLREIAKRLLFEAWSNGSPTSRSAVSTSSAT